MKEPKTSPPKRFRDWMNRNDKSTTPRLRRKAEIALLQHLLANAEFLENSNAPEMRVAAREASERLRQQLLAA